MGGGTMVTRKMLGVALVAVCTSAAAAAVEVPLTVTERAGVARVDNHVNSGVPLPVGAVKEVGELALFTADGKPVNAQIVERCRWLKDNSLKFVTVHFTCDLPANGKAEYVLKTGQARPVQTLAVQAGDEAVTVDTGPLKFTVTKKNFNVFDRVWLNGAEVVAPGTAALTLTATEGAFKVAGRALLDQESEPFETTPVASAIEVEEAGPVRAVVKVTGAFMKGDQKSLDFLARYYALAGSPSVRVAFTVVNRVGKKFEAFIGMKELSMTVPLKGAAGDVRYTFGAVKDPDIAGTLKSGQTATLLQLASTEYTVNGEKHPGGREENSRRLGWVDLSGGPARLAVGVRHFWQLYPKGLEVTGQGAVKVLLVAPGKSDATAGASAVPMFTGGARTHEVLFAFHQPAADGRGLALGVVDPLFAQAPTDWYCQKTWGFGQLYDANLENFKPEHRDLVKGFQAGLDRSFIGVVSWKDGKRQGQEEYGFFNWGANVHHGTLVRKTGWIDTGWNGNYYDFPFAAMVNFVRTGDPLAWDIAQAHALHLADIDICHWHPTNQKLNGIEHVCYSIGHFRQFWGNEPFGVSGNADSTKNQSLYHLYYLTGDAWYLDVALLVSDYNAVHGGGALRARGNRMTGLYGSYEATHKPEHLERWKAFVQQQGIALAKSRGTQPWDQAWMYGLAGEGLMTYYRTTGDLEAAEAVRVCADSLIKNFWQENAQATSGGTPGFTVNVFGYAYELTGNEDYLKKGLGQLAASTGADRSKSFAQQFRLSPQFLYYLAKDYQPPKPVLGAESVFAVPEAPKPKPPEPPKPTVSPGRAEFPAARDLRVMSHDSEALFNGGGGTLIRARNINSKSGEFTLVDFDAAAVKAFLDANKNKSVTAVLDLNIGRIQNAPATLRVLPLLSTVDWNEGTQTQAAARPGEACYAWAQKDKVRWTNADGQEVPDVRAAVYDRVAQKVLVKENSQSVELKGGETKVSIPLDLWLVTDLATNEKNRGLIVFTAQPVDGPQAIIDFRSRDTKAGPKLILEAKE